MTFTGGFDLTSVEGLELVFDERASAESLSSRFRTEHYEMVMHEGDMAYALPDLIWHLEDLRVGMCYQNYYIARLASKFVKVTLSGAGGDELFGGYPWRYEQVADLQRDDDFERAYFDYWCRLVPPSEHGSFFTAATREAAGGLDAFDVFRDVLSPVRGLDPYSKALYFERKTFLNGLLVVEDRVSMAHSLEARVPFLDNGLARPRRAHPVAAPVQRRRGQAGAARGCRRPAARGHRAGAQAGLQPARPILVPRPDDGLHPGDPARRAQSLPRLVRARRGAADDLGAHRGTHQPPPAAVVAAVVRVVEPALPRRRAAAPGHPAARDAARPHLLRRDARAHAIQAACAAVAGRVAGARRSHRRRARGAWMSCASRPPRLVIVAHSYNLTNNEEPLRRFGGPEFGDIAVAVFFAISGLLVTASWFSDPRLRSFLMRRALRILPGLWVVLLATVAVGLVVTTLPVTSYLTSLDDLALSDRARDRVLDPSRPPRRVHARIRTAARSTARSGRCPSRSRPTARRWCSEQRACWRAGDRSCSRRLPRSC